MRYQPFWDTKKQRPHGTTSFQPTFGSTFTFVTLLRRCCNKSGMIYMECTWNVGRIWYWFEMIQRFKEWGSIQHVRTNVSFHSKKWDRTAGKQVFCGVGQKLQLKAKIRLAKKHTFWWFWKYQHGKNDPFKSKLCFRMTSCLAFCHNIKRSSLLPNPKSPTATVPLI